ncbi:MAG TPA: exosortase/archaeosortase family protein [Bryobacteraceae bacterium]|jgi:exosortase|nr:exosortase/archaeosortase family protein [Bryobacteraceae bacterium]
MATIADKLPGQVPSNVRTVPWPAIAWFGILLIGAYFPILVKLVVQWGTDDDWTHGFFVPVVAGYIAWTRRETLLSTEWKPAWWGIGIVLWAGVQGYLGLLGAELFLQRTAFLLSLLGMLLILGGTGLIRQLAFPLLLLPFMIPLPTVVYNQITFPLQLFASAVAEKSLDVLNVPVLRDGNILELASQKLSVAEACSGIRSLLSLSFLALVYAYLFDRKVWMRWVLLVATVPIAIVANAARVTLTGVFSEIDPALAAGFFHEAEGFVIFAVALVMLVVVHQLLNWVYRRWHKEPSVPKEQTLA